DHRRQTLTDEMLSLEAVADFTAERLQRPLNSAANVIDQAQITLTRVLPPWAGAPGRRFFLTNADGAVIAENPIGGDAVGRRLVDLFGPAHTLTTCGAGAGVLEILLPNDTKRSQLSACSTHPLASSRSCDHGMPPLPVGVH